MTTSTLSKPDEQANVLYLIPLASWVDSPLQEIQQNALSCLEHGKILYLKELPFHLSDTEHRFLSPVHLKQHSKNISLDHRSGKVSGANCSGREHHDLLEMMDRFARHATSLVRNLLPRYALAAVRGRTSFRPVEIQGRSTSRKMDDTLLHIDAFPSNPTQGQRILRVFSNVNRQCQDRIWHVGQPFERVAEVFLSDINRPFFGTVKILQWLRITQSRRTLYDHFMLKMHDAMKENTAYQSSIEYAKICFNPGSTWIVFTDQVSHAAISGQHVLEQTFYLPVSAMANEARSPLRVLEQMKGASLA